MKSSTCVGIALEELTHCVITLIIDTMMATEELPNCARRVGTRGHDLSTDIHSLESGRWASVFLLWDDRTTCLAISGICHHSVGLILIMDDGIHLRRSRSMTKDSSRTTKLDLESSS